MKRISLIIALLMLTVGISVASTRVLVLTIDDDISAQAWRNTSRALEAFNTASPAYDMLVLRLNTYGGEVDMADSIRTALMRQHKPTMAFIDHNAASAGALISLACDTIIMSPSATIGAASVVSGSGEIMPPKYQSYWSSIMRSTAMAHGKYIPEGDSVVRWRRNPDIAADMVNPERAISLTAVEAVDCGMADGVANSIVEALARIDVPEPELTYYEPSTSDSLLGFLASAAVRAILITLIIGGIYMEMHTPGLGFAAAVAIVAAVLYFLPVVITGSLASWVVICFILGIVLLVLEIFVVPGFGVTGISGIGCIIASLLGVMLNPGQFAGSIWSAVVTLVVGIVLAVALVWWLTSRYGPSWVNRVIALEHEQKAEDGYIGVDTAPAELLGATGIAHTDLRPSGKVEIDGQFYDATSTGEFIVAGTTVVVVRYEAAQIYVRKV